MTCNHCHNDFGFALGTCVTCGFNNDAGVFRFIKVHVNDLPEDTAQTLIEKHARNTKNSPIKY